MRDTEREAETQAEGEAGSMQGALQDHALSQRQTLNHGATQVSQKEDSSLKELIINHSVPKKKKKIGRGGDE